MTIEYLVEFPNEMSKENIKDFEYLLSKQGQIDTIEGKVELCYKICLVKLNGNSIAIGALKQVYKSPFNYAGVTELQDQYNFELGYLFVDKDAIDDDFGSLGIGKYITRLLLNEVRQEEVFATTENSEKNIMYHILKSYSFIVLGTSYKGRKTKKDIVLMALNRKNLK